jgi:hypothetical protein
VKQRLIGLTLSLAAATGVAQAGTIVHVANNGLDGPGCGTAASPCRSISAGIGAAAEGDTIAVHPGLYGELDMDGELGSQGEETGDNAGMLVVNKRVTIISTGGPKVTSIRGIEGRSIVHMTASGAQFGAKDAGFTLNNTNFWGVDAEPLARGKIAGNILRNLPSGISIRSSELWEVNDNVVSITGGQAIVAQSANNGTGVVWVHDNLVYGDDYMEGIQVGPRAAHRVYDNVVNGPYFGITVTPGPSRIMRNVVTNARLGLLYSRPYDIVTADALPVVTRNSFIGNRGSGMLVFQDQPFGITLRENNFYGNGSCGAATSGGTGTVDARNNYWGAPTGPSFVNPADPICDSPNSAILYQPFATQEFAIR